MLNKIKKQFQNRRIERINRNNFKKRGNKELIILPLYFGWEVVLRKVDDIKKHIIGPFKEYWQYLSVVFLLIMVVSTGLIIKNHYQTQAATYNWTQSSWSGGASTTATAVHPTNQANWNQYSAKDASTSAGATVSITSETATLTHTTTADFSGGTSQGVLTTGDQISLDLP